MAWVPEGISDNVLAAAVASTDWASGGSVGIAPHLQASAIHAFRINTKFVSQSIQYEQGMQGQYMGDNGKGFAKIFIQGVTEGDGFGNRWVPHQYLDVGPPWEDDIENWNVDLQTSGTISTNQLWTPSSLPDSTVLGKTITCLITAFRHSPPSFDSGRITDLIDRHGISALTRVIIDGIKKAGLYYILASDKPFKGVDLIKAAKYQIRDRTSSNEAGAYLRMHLTNNNVTLWTPKATYAYVGKTNDFAARNYNHDYSTSSYGEMTRNSQSLVMIALCILAKTAEDGMFFLTEQIFVCLLETYKPNVADPSRATLGTLRTVQTAKYFKGISEAVFRTTGWQGFISRGPKSCGVQFGANGSSPLFEYVSRNDKFLYIRTDVNIKDGKTGSVVPMAYYRRTGHHTSQPGVSTRSAMCRVVYKNGKRKPVVDFLWTNTAKRTAQTHPPSGSHVEVVFEVRKDGTPHPHAWARLSDIGPFENWGQANSFACRLEWEYPLGSGKWRFTYIHRTNIYTRFADDQVPGSLPTYSGAISFLQWLTNSTPNHTHGWIPRLGGACFALQNEYDFMNQIIRFRDQKNDIVMISGRARSDHEMRTLMRQPKYGFGRVGGVYGFPEDSRIKAALVSMPVVGIPEHRQNFSQKWRIVTQGNQIDDDGSDCDEDDIVGDEDDV
ncbi:hypothetical protein J4E93_009572 [Alternaria ventricosa]|uniref:uncharacterized protein n=1 Tax=Alternaria ventricosa TaxID=1187951 RepID=UPI0020C31584|nr:uncharacterized protein J4E93_009572 [Alternaria ventricosa]KAI4639082.1 hypothetical protein J4E93_009572 [Alternaria ventricosa]